MGVDRKEYQRQWYQKNRARVSANGRAYRARKPMARHRVRTYALNKYGLTDDTFDQLRGHQGGACAVCREPLTATPQVDHCHTTGLVRGLLCLNCNNGLGRLRDDPAVLLRAVEYLTNPPSSVLTSPAIHATYRDSKQQEPA